MGVFVPLFAESSSAAAGPARHRGHHKQDWEAVFAIFYAAWELVLGVGTGSSPRGQRATPSTAGSRAGLVDSYAESGVIVALSVVGSIGLAVAMLGAAVALRGAYQLGWAPLALMLLAIPLIAIHEPPFGPVGLAMFIAAVLLLVRQQVSAAAPSAPPIRAQPA